MEASLKGREGITVVQPQSKVQSRGRGRPRHTEPKVKNRGQECPLYTEMP